MIKIISHLKKFPDTKKYLMLTSLLTILVGSGIVIHQSDYPLVIKNRFFQERVNSVMGIKIGDSKETVLYKLGNPVIGVIGDCEKFSECKGYVGKSKLSDEIKNSYNHFTQSDNFDEVYKKITWMIFEIESRNHSSNDLNIISFSFKNNKVSVIKCGIACDAILGIKYGDSEKKVIQFLGRPDKQKIEISDSPKKEIYYDKFGLSITLVREKVNLITISGDK